MIRLPERRNDELIDTYSLLKRQIEADVDEQIKLVYKDIDAKDLAAYQRNLKLKYEVTDLKERLFQTQVLVVISFLASVVSFIAVFIN